jgi:hypothetical protein
MFVELELLLLEDDFATLELFDGDFKGGAEHFPKLS